MPRYVITEKAGRFVAGHTNTGTGTILSLTKKAADHELRLGTLLPVDEAPSPLPREPNVVEPVAASSSLRTVSAEVVVADDAEPVVIDAPQLPSRRRRRPIADGRHDD